MSRRYSDMEIREIEVDWDLLVAWKDTVRGRLGTKGIERFRRMYEIPSDLCLDDWMENRFWGLIERYSLARGLEPGEAQEILINRPYIDIIKDWKEDFR